jgi:sec-independent protein translocase protein TatC
MENECRMSFFDHLEELRVRLIRGVTAILIGFVACIYFGDKLFQILASPLAKLLPGDNTLVFTSLADPFFMHLKVAFVAGVFLTIPYVLYQLWLFIAPGLQAHEAKLALPFVVIATFLFYLGAVFAYFLVFPTVFQFFLSYQSPELKPMISIKDYVSLVMKLMLGFGAIFETPVIVVFLGLLGVVSTDTLKRGRRYFVVGGFIIAAILTPPDVVSQVMMALPLILLFELSIQVLAIIDKRRKKREAEEAEMFSSEDY